MVQRILTGWGQEILTPALALRFGIGSDVWVGKEVAVAKAACGDQCWWQMLGLAFPVNRASHAAALAAIHLGQRLRAEAGVDEANAIVVSSDVAAAVQGHTAHWNVRWAPREVTAPLRALSLADVTRAEGNAACLDACNRLSSIDGSLARKVVQHSHPIWQLPDIIGASLIVSVSAHKKVREKMRELDRQAKSKDILACRRLNALEAAFGLHRYQILASQGIHEELPYAVMADPSQWDGYAPAMVAAWQRLDILQQAAMGGANLTEQAMELVRNLDPCAFVLLGALNRGTQWPLHPFHDTMGATLQTVMRETIGFDMAPLLYGKKGRLARDLWRRISTHVIGGRFQALLDSLDRPGSDPGEQALLKRMLGLIHDSMVPLYPLSEKEAALVAGLQERRQAQEQQAAERRAEEARLAQLSREERQRQIALAKAEEERRIRLARLEEITALTAGRRSIAILKDEAYWRSRWNDLQPEWQAAAEVLKTKRQNKADERAEAKRAKEEERLRQLAQAPIPVSRYLTIEETDGHVRVHFDPPTELTRGSRSLHQDACYVARSRLSQARFSRLADGGAPVNDWTATTVEARVPRTEMAKLGQAVANIDRALDAWQRKPLAPYHLEQVLGINQTERYRWTKAGKFHIEGYDTFTKGYRTLEYPLFNRMQIFSLTPETLAAWREQDAKKTAARRKEGAKKAVQSRAVNAELRATERMRIDAVAREAAREAGDLRFISLLKLAIYAQLASRWAKTYQVRRNGSESERFYKMKDKALRVIAQSGTARIAFVPAEEARVSVDLCGRHRDDWREWRSEMRDMTDFEEWLDFNRKTIQKCSGCRYSEDRHYYSLYQIELAAGDLRLSFHVPYPIGRSWLPAHGTLPQLADESVEGMFRYGRPVTEDEMLLHPAKEVETEIHNLLAFFQEEAQAQRATGTDNGNGAPGQPHL